MTQSEQELDYNSLPHHPLIEDLTNALMAKTGQTQPHFFRLLAAYSYSLIATYMGVSIKTKDRGSFPVNLYAINLATSGFGKGHSVSIITESVMAPFMNTFMKTTVPAISEIRCEAIAKDRAHQNGTTMEEELPSVQKDLRSTGPYLPVFDSGTAAAFKQLRTQLLMTGVGCLNMRTDELGSNLLDIQEILAAFIEAFDVGVINPKLVKHTKDQERIQTDSGRTPPMWLGFGTPSKVLDGGKVEEVFMDNLETGLARRCFFGLCIDQVSKSDLTAEEIFNVRTNKSSSTYLDTLGARLQRCAEIANHRMEINLSKELSIELIRYEMRNKTLADSLPEHRSIERTELMHRHAKTLKLAGALAFVNGDLEITKDTLFAAIRMAEDSGLHFTRIMQREQAHVRLARYLGSVGKPVTQAELIANLPYYKGSEAVKRDMMTLAISYGLRNNISITRRFTQGVEEIEGSTLKTTDPNKISFSYSNDIAYNYRPVTAPFSKMDKLVLQKDLHWAVHQFKQGHRHRDNVITGFNLLVLDVDDGMSIDTVRLLLKDYMYCIHTTKSHGLVKAAGGGIVDKFRILIPLSHTLHLSADDYYQFMESVFDSLPFSVDTAAKDIARKWQTHPGDIWFNEGKLWDVLPHIPATTSADEHREKIANLYSLTHLERWFMINTAAGNRSNNLLRFGSMLVDSGADIDTVINGVSELNSKIQDPLPESELEKTVFRTMRRKVLLRNQEEAA